MISSQTRSSATAMPWPTPMHMVASAQRAERSRSSSAAVPAMRAPDAERTAIAPPSYRLRPRPRGMPRSRSTGDALGGKGFVELDHAEVGWLQAEPFA